MNLKNENKLNNVKQYLDKLGLFYLEYPNGQLQIDSVNFWVTTEKFYDTRTGYKGEGINAFIAYIKKKLNIN